MHHYLEKCLACLEGATGGLNDVQGRTRLGDGWSIAEIVEHLDRTYSGTTKGFERCLAADKPLVTRSTLAGRIARGVVVGFGYFPKGHDAPKHVMPSGHLDLSEAMSSVRRSLRAFDLAAIGASARFGRAKVLDHPILGPLSVDQWRRFHWIHTKHHRKHIEERRRLA